jgi:hypothetical protein
VSDPVVLWLAGFLVGVLFTPAGISGAFLLVPFQTSLLGATTVSVTPTNLLYNTVATPAGILAYWRRGALDWRLATLITAGSLPGVLVGLWLRIRFLSDPRQFRAVVGVVLIVLAGSLMVRRKPDAVESELHGPGNDALVIGAAVVVGVLGGVYGVGGAAFLGPFLVWRGLPLRRIAGATLVGTWVTSVVGVVGFTLAGRWDPTSAPAWTTGLLLGLGGVVGSFLGARLQPRVPETALRIVLGVAVLGLGLYYVYRSLKG